MRQPFPQHLAESVRRAAWSRPIGLPLQHPGRKTESHLVDDGYYQGIPIGGLGSGSIGRTYRGDFARWHLDVGRHWYGTVAADQFSVWVSDGQRSIAQVLWTGRPTDRLRSWHWDYPVGAGTYYALFPRAWFVYDWEPLPVVLSCKQLSPVIPGNYRESSYPVGVFEWEVYNPTDRSLTVAIMLTGQNPLGWGDRENGPRGNRNRTVVDDTIPASGVILGRDVAEVSMPWEGELAIAAKAGPG